MTPNIKAAIAAIGDLGDDAWTTIEYTDAIRDETTGELISSAKVAEIAFTAFASAKKAHRGPGRLVVRRLPDFNAPADPNQASLFELWRFHAFFTTTDPEVLNTVAADKTHRGHAPGLAPSSPQPSGLSVDRGLRPHCGTRNAAVDSEGRRSSYIRKRSRGGRDLGRLSIGTAETTL
jgi:hypothetical protein